MKELDPRVVGRPLETAGQYSEPGTGGLLPPGLTQLTWDPDAYAIFNILVQLSAKATAVQLSAKSTAGQSM